MCVCVCVGMGVWMQLCISNRCCRFLAGSNGDVKSFCVLCHQVPGSACGSSVPIGGSREGQRGSKQPGLTRDISLCENGLVCVQMWVLQPHPKVTDKELRGSEL